MFRPLGHPRTQLFRPKQSGFSTDDDSSHTVCSQHRPVCVGAGMGGGLLSEYMLSEYIVSIFSSIFETVQECTRNIPPPGLNVHSRSQNTPRMHCGMHRRPPKNTPPRKHISPAGRPWAPLLTACPPAPCAGACPGRPLVPEPAGPSTSRPPQPSPPRRPMRLASSPSSRPTSPPHPHHQSPEAATWGCRRATSCRCRRRRPAERGTGPPQPPCSRGASPSAPPPHRSSGSSCH